jgi:metallo-beta-lactamase class B
MRCKSLFIAAFVAFLLVSSFQAGAQGPFKKEVVARDVYVKPFPPFRIVGDLYYVGTYDLAVYLITTKEGNILINTGINDSAPAIRANIESLGFKFSDVKLLLATHGHWDHVGALAEIKQLTGAQMLMHEGDVDLLESGGGRDFRFPEGRGTIYPPIKVDRRLKDGDKVRLGETELTVLHHPGHTKGATSFTYTTEDGGRKYEVLIVNMPSINPGVTVRYMPGYPQINEAYLTTLAKQKQLKPQVWVSSHAGHFDMHQKYKPGDPYDPNRFVDPEGYQKKIQSYERLFNEAQQREREGKTSQ